VLYALDERLGRLAGDLVAGVTARARATVAAFAVGTAALLAFAVSHLGFNTDENELFSGSLPSFERRAEYYRLLPILADPIVVVLDGATVDLAERAAADLGARLATRTDLYARVHRPDGGAFIEEHGLLYLPDRELEALLDNLVSLQPYLAELSRDPSLRGFLELLADASGAAARGEFDGVELAGVFERIEASATDLLAGDAVPLSWAEVLNESDPGRRGRRRFLILEPIVDFSRLSPAEPNLLEVRRAASELGLEPARGVRLRTTGTLPLAYEEMEQVSAQTTLAGLSAFVLVAVLLVAGLRSLRLVLASLATLIAGLIWTTAFAAAAIGYVNLISIAFAVLFIGLSIDFAIHLCVCFRDGRAAGLPAREALVEAARSVGGALVLCAVTTAVGFYAFLPTTFAGVAELGTIAGTGILISLFANLTLLPALVALAPPAALPPPWRLPAAVARALDFPVRRPRTVLLGAIALGLAAAAALPAIRFDPNPLRVRDPATGSVSVLREMLEDGDALPWNMNALAGDLASAEALAERLEALPAVASTITLADYLPENQDAKLAMIRETAYLVLPTLAEGPTVPAPTAEERRRALDALCAELAGLEQATSGTRLAVATARLRAALDRLHRAPPGGDLDAALGELERLLLDTLPGRLDGLRQALGAGPVALADLPADLRDRMQADDGRLRIEIYPQGDLDDVGELHAYVDSVQALAPDAFGEALIILESGRIVVEAFRQALLLAALAILALLFLLWRSPRDVALVAAPMLLATLLTGAGAILLGIPFNFANAIVLPLLLGIGVDSGIHLVHRARTQRIPGGNLLRTGTARGVLLSALTTLASFGTLALSSHGGMASLGRLLALGLLLILSASLIVLPALVRLIHGPPAPMPPADPRRGGADPPPAHYHPPRIRP
jgi:hypothetical protein